MNEKWLFFFIFARALSLPFLLALGVSFHSIRRFQFSLYISLYVVLCVLCSYILFGILAPFNGSCLFQHTHGFTETIERPTRKPSEQRTKLVYMYVVNGRDRCAKETKGEQQNEPEQNEAMDSIWRHSALLHIVHIVNNLFDVKFLARKWSKLLKLFDGRKSNYAICMKMEK